MKQAKVPIIDMDPIEVLKYLHKNVDQADALFSQYVEHLPKMVVRYRALGSGELPCDEWLFLLSDSHKLHCEHCIHHPLGCKYQCLANYKTVLSEFCSLCNHSPKQSCQQKAFSIIKGAVEGKPPTPDYLRHNEILAASCSFNPIISNRQNIKIADFFIPRVSLRKPDSSDVVRRRNIIQRLYDFCTIWLEGSMGTIDRMGERRILEITVAIVAIHYMFFRDIQNSTVLLSMGIANTADSDIDNHESANVIFSGIASHNKANPADILKASQDNINPDEVLIGPGLPRLTSIVHDHKNLMRFVELIENIYRNPLLPSHKMSSISKSIFGKIQKYLGHGDLRSTNIRLNGPGKAYVDQNVDPLYLQYRIYIKMAALMGAIRRSRFTTKIPKLFKDNNLLKLYDEFRKGSVGLTFKGACKKIGFKDSTVIAAIDKYKEMSPAFKRVQDAIKNEYGEKAVRTHYSMHIIIATPDDLRAWQQNVQNLVL